MKKYEVTITDRDSNGNEEDLYDSLDFRFKTIKEATDFMNAILLNRVYGDVYCELRLVDVGGK